MDVESMYTCMPDSAIPCLLADMLILGGKKK